MSVLANSNAIEVGGYNISNSLRFRASNTAYLNRTLTTPTNNKIWTWSAWVKRSTLTTTQVLFATSGDELRYISDGGASGVVDSFQYNLSTGLYGFRTNATYRDPSAWYHIVVAVDTTQATAANRSRIYINGTEASTDGTYGIVQNANTQINSAVAHNIGRRNSGSLYFDGYMTEINFVDGQQLTPSSFGATDPVTGVWAPKKYTGTYGTNGFYLKFSDIATTSGSNAGLGKDFSGNTNYWNTNNISVTAGATYDAMLDVPTLTSATISNYCTANPLDASPSGTSVLSNGNLTVNVSGSSAGGGYGGQARCNTINFTNVSGKWYWEAFINNAGTGAATLRLTFFMDDEPVNISAQSGPWAWYWRADGVTDLTSPGTFATNDVVMFAYDSDTGKLWVGKNGTWSNSGAPASGTGQVKTLTALTAYALGLNYGTSGGGTGTASFNFGQRPFSYTPPSGFVALNTFNLPDSTIKKGNSYMDATLYTGNGSNRSITNAAGFRPDLVWGQARSSAYGSWLYDAVRGATKQIESFGTNAESTQSTMLTAFNSDGFSMGTDTAGNQSTTTYVAWQWQAGSSTVTNTNGTISSQVRANTTTGFSIVTYTGNGTSGATIGHGLGVAPKMILVKNRTASLNDWQVYHTSLTSAAYRLRLNTSDAQTSQPAAWNSTAPTSTVFTVGNAASVNGSTNAIVAYCFAEIAGFSKFGSYTGNGSTDGPFVYLGFRPKFVLVKAISVANDWDLFDSSRDPYNVAGKRLQTNSAGAESATMNNFDFVSNGFKIRNNTNTTEYNGNGTTYIYVAFAENPFKNSLAR